MTRVVFLGPVLKNRNKSYYYYRYWRNQKFTGLSPKSSEGQETGAIAPTPENARKKCLGAWSISPVIIFPGMPGIDQGS
jgi:hypothetical protein